MWTEAVLAAVALVLTVVTAIWPTWIESLFEVSPDGGDGSAERLFALGWLAVAVVFSALARRDHRRLGSAGEVGA
jgi:hypothetical protein